MSGHVPYESLAHAEADDIVIPDNLPTSLRELDEQQLQALHELVADGYARGLEAGFAMSDSGASVDSPGDVAEAYAAGYEQGKIDKGE